MDEPAEAPSASCIRIERQIAVMGTVLVIEVRAPSRALAILASQAVVQAVESAERRLSTWRDDSELAALNRAVPGEPFALPAELARELDLAARCARDTLGAFDPAVGGLVRVWDLRGAGRIPSDSERRDAVIAGGILGALSLESAHAVRRDSRLVLEEGGFGKGAALDAALAALDTTAACDALLDFGGQIAWFPGSRGSTAATRLGSDAGPRCDPAGHRERTVDIADPRDRARIVARLRTHQVSAATSGNGERARLVDGRRVGHILDPRSGHLAPDFGSVTVLAGRALDADALATGLFTLGPDEALARAASLPEVDVVVVEDLGAGRLRLRASARAAARLEIVDERAAFVGARSVSAHRSGADR